MFGRSFSERQPLLGLAYTSRCLHARRFWTASSSDDAKTQFPKDPTAGPALKGISSTNLTFQRARARDRLAPGGRMAFVPPCAPGIQEAAS